jgi:DNA polymerase III subunit chi
MEVAFHAGVVDPIGHSCRLLRKAYRQGARLVCTVPRSQLEPMDRALWVFDAQEFVPHVRFTPSVPPSTLQRSPIWLAEHLPEHPLRPDIWVNLGAELPASLAGLSRIIEVVGGHDELVVAGRQRWKQYLALGVTPVRTPMKADA